MQVILNQIEKIRAKPEASRRRWAAGLTAACTSVIVLVWALNLNLSATDQVAEKAKSSPFGQVASVAAVDTGNIWFSVADSFKSFLSMFND